MPNYFFLKFFLNPPIIVKIISTKIALFYYNPLKYTNKLKSATLHKYHGEQVDILISKNQTLQIL